MAPIAFFIKKYCIVSFQCVSFIPVQPVLAIKINTIIIDINFAISKTDSIKTDTGTGHVYDLAHACWQAILHSL
jgi:hypothetical protein